MNSLFSRPALALLCLFVGLSCLLAHLTRDSSARSAATPFATVAAVAQPDESLRADSVVGHLQCLDCHRKEYGHWQKSRHVTHAYDYLRTKSSKRDDYAKELDIDPEKVIHADRCVQCHGTRRQEATHPVITSVTCEACHNAAGGEEGWLNAHAVYGRGSVRREHESREHFDYRAQRCRSAGQLRSSDTYELIKRCYQCHVIGDEELLDAGHTAESGGMDDDFVTDKWLAEGIPHNFHLNYQIAPPHDNALAATLWLHPQFGSEGRTVENRNKVLRITAFVADLEVSLRYIVNATDEKGDLLEGMMESIVDAYEELEDINDKEMELAEVGQILEILEDIYTKCDDEELTLGDEDKTACAAAADRIAEIGRTFAAQHDGSKLSDIEAPELPDWAAEEP